MTVNFSFMFRPKGWWRLWTLASCLWLVFVIVDNGFTIGNWAGYHYGSYKTHQSIAAVIKHKEELQISKKVCWQAVRNSCFVSQDGENPYNAIIEAHQVGYGECVKTDSFKKAYQASAQTLNFEFIQLGDGSFCPVIMDLQLPEINWWIVLGLVSVPLYPIIIFYLFRWVYIGFRATN
jgi:hypothetical protein